MTSGGTIKGLSLNPTTWIRDDGWLLKCSMPDKRNDQVKGSLYSERSAEDIYYERQEEYALNIPSTLTR